MSTLDPGLEPPGDWQSPYPPTPDGAGGSTDAANTAAVYVWVCAGLGMLMSCCCVFSAIGLSVLPTHELMRQMPPDIPNRDQIEQLLPTIAVMMGVVGVLLLLIPSLVFAVLAFKVRAGSRGVTIATMIILGLQTASLGLLLLINLAAALVGGSLGDLAGVIIIAGVFAVFVTAMIALWKALNPRSTLSRLPPAGPWGA
jgi:hypothetical protein